MQLFDTFKALWALVFLLANSLYTVSAHDLYNIQKRADSLSIPNGKESIRICDSMLSIKNKPALQNGIFYRIRGKAYYFNGDYRKAGEDFSEAVQLLNLDKLNVELGFALSDQAKLYRKLKMHAQAIETYSRAKSVFEELGEKNHLASVLNEWGVVYELMKDYTKAVQFYQSSLELKEELKDTIGIAYSNNFLSNVKMLEGNYEAAEDYAYKALLLFRQMKDPFNIALQSTDIALVYEKKKDYLQAIKYLQYSDSIAHVMSYPDLMSENYLRMAMVYAAQSDYASAYQFHRLYSALKDSLFTAASQKAIAELNVQYKTAEKDNRILIQESRLFQQRWGLFLSLLLLMSVAIIAFYIYRNKQLREQQLLKEAEHKEKLMRMEALQSIQQDRLRISRDLHDNIGSYLTFINTNIHSENPEIEILKQTTKESIEELRRTVWLINKSSVSVEEWSIKLREYHSKVKNIEIKAKLSDPELPLSAVQATGLFRIIQEAVNNALKYAGAGRITIRINQSERLIEVQVEDDGKGFDTGKVQQGFGLDNMKQRSMELEGECSIFSLPGNGTKVNVWFQIGI